MRQRWLMLYALLAFTATGESGQFADPRPTDAEMRIRREWVAEHLPGKPSSPNKAAPATLPFSFVYDGKSSRELLPEWPTEASTRSLDAVRTQQTCTWTDPRTGLQVKCTSVEYLDYPAAEWTATFRNTGRQDTPIVQEIQGLDATFLRAGAEAFVLHGIKGDWCTADSYEPYRMVLGAGASKRFAPSNNVGKSSSGPDGWPYFNLQMPEGGVMLAVGWPGQWQCLFERDNASGLRVRAGQELTHLVLRPGEEIRMPLMAAVFWQGADVVRAQNLWRRWFAAHNMPRTHGKTQQPITQIQVDGATTASVDAFLKAGIKPDICWRDAGAGGPTWYPSSTGPFKGADAWLNTGTWDVDPAKYPDGFRPFSDWVHSRGMQFLLWFEPERVGDPASWLGRNHPDWLLPCNEQGALLNEGNPAALRWLIDHVDGMIKAQGLDWYREDMNGVGPLPGWRGNDREDRQGITENLYVQGHLAFWDELRRRNPGLRIDSCASGGRRNDLETMRRAVPLLRSDFQFPSMQGVVEGNQGHTYGLSSWLPFYGSGCYLYDKYSYRSFYMPSFGMGGLTPENAEAQRTAYAECRKVAPYMLGDYYPLTPYSRQDEKWIAWQFHRPDHSDGAVQAFRRGACAQSTITLRLSALAPEARYEVTDLDVGSPVAMSGRTLMDEGLTVRLDTQPGAAVIVYERRKP